MRQAWRVPGLVERLDRVQQRVPALAVPVAVWRKFGDDRGGSLAALIAYYGFLSLFPLLLLFFTIVSYVLPHYPGAQRQLTRSVIGQFPVIGPQLQSNTDKPLHGSALALAVSLLALLWGAMGIAKALQEATDEVWDVPHTERLRFLGRLARGLVLFPVIGVGVVATTAVSSLGTMRAWGPLGSVLAAIPAVIVNTALVLLVFRILTPREHTARELLPGATLAAIGWQLLQTIGVNLVSHQLRHASQVYGVFGVTLGLLSFLAIAASLTVYSAELNVVLADGLWPRSLRERRAPAPGRAAQAPGPNGD